MFRIDSDKIELMTNGDIIVNDGLTPLTVDEVYNYMRDELDNNIQQLNKELNNGCIN